MAGELSQWQEHWTGKGYIYTIQDARNRVWRLRVVGSPGVHHWALSCEAHPELSITITRMGGRREFEFAERYIQKNS